MGADDAIHVEIPDKTPLEPLGVSKILNEVVKKAGEEEEVGLIIMGKQAIDDDASQTGQMLAGLLNWPQATYASKLEFAGKLEKGAEATITREIDGGLGVVKTKLPFVMTTDLRLNEPRYASLPNIMKAKKKPFKKFSLKDLGLEEAVKPRHETIKVEEPPKREGGAKVRLFLPLLSDTETHLSPLCSARTGRERRRARRKAQGGWPHLSPSSTTAQYCILAHLDQAFQSARSRKYQNANSERALVVRLPGWHAVVLFGRGDGVTPCGRWAWCIGR